MNFITHLIITLFFLVSAKCGTQVDATQLGTIKMTFEPPITDTSKALRITTVFSQPQIMRGSDHVEVMCTSLNQSQTLQAGVNVTAFAIEVHWDQSTPCDVGSTNLNISISTGSITSGSQTNWDLYSSPLYFKPLIDTAQRKTNSGGVETYTYEGSFELTQGQVNSFHLPSDDQKLEWWAIPNVSASDFFYFGRLDNLENVSDVVKATSTQISKFNPPVSGSSIASPLLMLGVLILILL